MDKYNQYVSIGAGVTAFGIALLASVVWFIVAQYAEEFDNFRISFKGPVTGLEVGSFVRYNGINVGTVSQMVLDAVNPQRVLVTVKLRPGLNIRQDSVATVDSAGLVGGARFVEIRGGTRSAPVIPVTRRPPYPFIHSRDSGFAQIEQAMPQISKKMETLTTRYRDVTGERNQRAIDNISKNYSRISKIFERSDFRNIASSYERAGNNLSVRPLNTERVAKEINQTSQKFSRLGADARKFSEESFDVPFTQLTNEFDRLSKSLDALGDRVEKKPLSFLTGEKRQGYNAKPDNSNAR